MFGLGTIINTACIIAGGIFGLLFGKLLNERFQNSLNMACGVSTFVIGLSGAMSGMLSLNTDGALTSGRSMLVVLCLAFGALIGELINLEEKFEKFGEWLKIKTGNARDGNFVNGFVTASLTVCIGAMAIVGSITDALTGDISILVTKGILDFVIVMVMTCSMGKGCIFSAIPVFVFQGSITALATLIKPIMTELAMSYLSTVGSVLIFCVGLNLIWGKKVRVANFLPSIIFAVAAAFLPISL